MLSDFLNLIIHINTVIIHNRSQRINDSQVISFHQLNTTKVGELCTPILLQELASITVGFSCCPSTELHKLYIYM